MTKGWLRRRWTAVLLSGLLTASVCLNGWLVLKVCDYKGRLLLSREFPDHTPLHVAKDGRQLVWLTGDSRVASWAMTDTAHRQFVNRGVSGFTARETLDRFRADLAAGTRPDVVVIQAGINDVLSAGYNRPSRLPPAARSYQPDRPRPGQIMEKCANDLNQLVATAVAAGGQVILLTVFPPGPAGIRDRFFWDAELRESVTRLNTSLQRLSGPSVTVLDAAGLLSSESQTRDNFSADVLHLNDEGYALLSRALEAELDRLSQSVSTAPLVPVPPAK